MTLICLIIGAYLYASNCSLPFNFFCSNHPPKNPQLNETISKNSSNRFNFWFQVFLLSSVWCYFVPRQAMWSIKGCSDNSLYSVLCTGFENHCVFFCFHLEQGFVLNDSNVQITDFIFRPCHFRHLTSVLPHCGSFVLQQVGTQPPTRFSNSSFWQIWPQTRFNVWSACCAEGNFLLFCALVRSWVWR